MFDRAKYKEDINLNGIADPVGSVKYDGGHYFIKFNKAGIPSFISRRQSVHGHYPDRTANLPQFHGVALPQYANHVLSAELIHTGHSKENPESHPAVSGILNSLPHNAIESQKINGPIRAVLLDVIRPKLGTYREKLNLLKKIEDHANIPELMYLPEFHTGLPAIQKLIEKTKNEGREGIIVASLSASEAQNPRLKIKHYKTYNLKVRGFLQEEDIRGNLKNSLGAFELEDGSGRHVGDVGTGLTRELRQHVWRKKKSWLGKIIQVRAMPAVRAGGKLKMMVYNGESDGSLDTVE